MRVYLMCSRTFDNGGRRHHGIPDENLMDTVVPVQTTFTPGTANVRALPLG